VAPQVVALDVGQGDAILIREGYRNILVDTGQNDAVLLRALARQGVSRLDAVIVTHLDDDHSGALDALGGTIPVEHVYFAAGLLEAKGEDAVIQTAQQLLSGKAPEELAWGDALRLGDNIALSVLWPDRRVSEGGNEESLCLGLSYSADGDSSPSTRLLLTGDAEAPQLEALLARAPVPDASAQTPTSGSSAPSTDAPTQTPAQGFAVLKVGHHGSKDAVTVEQLRRMGCVLALISVGRDNRYGHPAPDTLSVLDEAGVRVYRTDLNGDIRLRFDGGRLSVRCDTMEGQAP
jgi:competence protein ComEC